MDEAGGSDNSMSDDNGVSNCSQRPDFTSQAQLTGEDLEATWVRGWEATCGIGGYKMLSCVRKQEMEKKRTSTDENQAGSKRARVDEAGGSDNSMSDDDGVSNCSQRPDLTSQAQLTEAENGIIEKITMLNFMCHSNLSVNLGPNVNFIIGRNGSGKSAIITAIVVGLGGKAWTTNRGNCLKGFVKDKCSTAIIKIQLKNSGSDAFKADQYGAFITVERTISCDGTGSYKIMAANGSVISTKKDELNNLLDHFNIQIDNPVSILNQDTSRNFLCASSPEMKYKFFLKATQLEQMSNVYLTIQEKQDIIKNTLEKKKEVPWKR